MTTRTPSAFIFDLDGTLLDTEPLYTQATQQVVDEFGKEFTWEVKQRSMGHAAQVSAEILVASMELPISAEEYLRRREPLLERLFAGSPEMPGARLVVEGLASMDRKLAVATSSTRRMFELKTSRHPWFSAFQTVVCGDDPRVKHPKPAPDIYRVVASALGVAPKEAVAFEDSPAGAHAAAAAGCTVLVLADPRADRSLYPPGVTFVDMWSFEPISRLGVARSVA